MKMAESIAKFIRREIRQECTPNDDHIAAGLVYVFGTHKALAYRMIHEMREAIREEHKAAGEFPIAGAE